MDGRTLRQISLPKVFALVSPPALGTAWVLTLFAGTGTPVWALWRPLAIVLLAIFLGESIVLLVVRRIALTSLLTAVVTLSLIALWVVSLPLAGALVWWFSVNRWRRRRRSAPLPAETFHRLAGNFAFITVLLLMLVVTQAWLSGAFWASSRSGVPGMARPGRPDIYLIMLDGYPGSSVLRGTFGIDNSAFEADLGARGFDVSADSRSNYTMTWITLASMFEMDYVQSRPELRDVSSDGPTQYRRLGALINDGRSISILRNAGYQVISSSSPYSDAALTNADEVLPTPTLTRFEEQLIEESALAGIAADWLADRLRENVEVALRRPAEVAARGADRPTFMFDHVMSPHPPFVFQADGSARRLEDCFPTRCSLHEIDVATLGLSSASYRSAMAGQITSLNRKVIQAVDELLREDPDAIVILFSDHATRHDISGDPQEANQNFLAARTPGVADLFGETPSTVNLLPILFNHYLGTRLEIRAYEAWLSVRQPLKLQPLTSPPGASVIVQ